MFCVVEVGVGGVIVGVEGSVDASAEDRAGAAEAAAAAEEAKDTEDAEAAEDAEVAEEAGVEAVGVGGGREAITDARIESGSAAKMTAR